MPGRLRFASLLRCLTYTGERELDGRFGVAAKRELCGVGRDGDGVAAKRELCGVGRGGNWTSKRDGQRSLLTSTSLDGLNDCSVSERTVEQGFPATFGNSRRASSAAKIPMLRDLSLSRPGCRMMPSMVN